MYRGVPLIEVTTSLLEDKALAKPKSHNFTIPLAEIRIFYGFFKFKKKYEKRSK